MRGGSCSSFLRNSLKQLLPPKMVTHYTDVETNHSRAVEVGGIKLDNRWVVPYNPYLLLKYNAHINVEICITVSAVKYLYKYV